MARTPTNTTGPVYSSTPHCNSIYDDFNGRRILTVNEDGTRDPDGIYCISCYDEGFLVGFAQHPRTTAEVVRRVRAGMSIAIQCVF